MATLGSIPSNQELITGTNVTLGGLNLASLYPDPGVDKPASLKVTQRGAGANMSVDVAAGSAYVSDDSSGINLISKASVTNLTVSNGDAGGIRHDFVTIDSSGTLSVLEGTVGADPTPAVNTHVLARIRVPANETTSIDDADIDDKREYGSAWRRPRGFIDEGVITSDGTQTASLTNEINITLITFADRKYLIEGEMTIKERNSSLNEGRSLIRRDSTTLHTAWATLDSQWNVHYSHHYVDTPGAGTFIYRLSREADFQIKSRGSLSPTRLHVTDVGGLDKPTGSEGQ